MRHFYISVSPVIICPIKDFSPKTLNNVGCDLRRKGITTKKSAFPNTCHTFWNVDTNEGITTTKSGIPNVIHTVWNVDACKEITVSKSIFPNACYTVRNGIVRFFSSIRNNSCLIFVK